MKCIIQNSCENIDWQIVFNLMQEAGLAVTTAELTKTALKLPLTQNGCTRRRETTYYCSASCPAARSCLPTPR